jgi:hypothetical protein
VFLGKAAAKLVGASFFVAACALKASCNIYVLHKRAIGGKVGGARYSCNTETGTWSCSWDVSVFRKKHSHQELVAVRLINGNPSPWQATDDKND